MRKITGKIFSIALTAFLLIFAFPILSAKLGPDTLVAHRADVSSDDSLTVAAVKKATLYESLNLKAMGLSEQAFTYALKGYDHLLSQGKLLNDKVLTIIDFSKPSTEKRMFVVDLEAMQVLYQTYVSHGRNSGKLYADKFSNTPESYMSSLGAYTTGQTYFGQHGLSLRLHGEEKGINDNAYKRAIVIHGADYSSQGFINRLGYLGRSFGCPALPKELSKPIIETIKDGSYMFVYAPSKSYDSKSTTL